MEKFAVGEVEAAYMLGLDDFAEARRILNGIPVLPGRKRRYSLDEIRKRAGHDLRTSPDLKAVEDALIARAAEEGRAWKRRREEREAARSLKSQQDSHSSSP